MASRSQPIGFVRHALLDVAAHSALKVALTWQRPCRPTHTASHLRVWVGEGLHQEAWPDSSSTSGSSSLSTASSFNHIFLILMFHPAAAAHRHFSMNIGLDVQEAAH